MTGPATEWQENPVMFHERSRNLDKEEAQETGLFAVAQCPPKAEVTDSNSVGCTKNSLNVIV